MRGIAATVALACASVLACSFGAKPAVPRDGLARQIESGTAPTVLDVRSDSEFAGGHVPGAAHIPFTEVDDRHAELGLARDEPIVVYCAHGPRAAWAARSLREAGYTDVVFLEGHMSAWEDDGLPVEAAPAADETSD